MTTNIYVDGFNLYYGALRTTSFKWLNLTALCSTLLPGRQIKRIRYFTARINAWPHDNQAPVRQDIYLRALRTIPNLSIHEGRFVSWPNWMPKFPLQYPNPSDPPQSVRVLRTEEKGSDVNLATYLLTDCFDNDFDEAVVISNDSDLALPIGMVKEQFRKVVGVINPHPKTKISGDLINASSWHFRTINKKVLVKCQFLPTLVDAKGTFQKPATW